MTDAMMDEISDSLNALSTHVHTGAAGDGSATLSPLTTHAAAADPHTGYVLESLLDAK